ncbi:hypothetical protein CSKR_104911 [Clonorchis sinensis]|uniref:Uncharacterized protein n=1 Tax=Clonorchis sinensis TaxID=79923 RepID=A0A3R7D6B6_CLOSI|nr:hypothetical protein CSKR_104911 [Clonorchis sinensis]
MSSALRISKHMLFTAEAVSTHRFNPISVSKGKTTASTSEINSFCKQIWFCERLTWNQAESLVCDVSRQWKVLHQAASGFSCYDIRDIANIRLTETRGLRLPDEPQEGRNRWWAVGKFSATL